VYALHGISRALNNFHGVAIGFYRKGNQKRELNFTTARMNLQNVSGKTTPELLSHELSSNLLRCGLISAELLF
jgi:hypothetical protein